MSSPRVRFAPSPTGQLHIGNARTGLFNYLFARRMGGTLVLRMEDTDQARGDEEYERSHTEGLSWLGITVDEGMAEGGEFGPYRQSERSETYEHYLQSLIDSGHVYPCYCTPEELEAEREIQRKNGEAPRYSGRCRDLSDEDRATFEAERRNPVFRFKVPPAETVEFDDLIRERVIFRTEYLGDFVIARTDRSPLYSFANVVDDHLMQITHVVRGEDLLPTTPNQILLYQALGLEPPAYAHLPLLLGSDRKKLSKRFAATSIDEYRDQGYLPEAMINFLALLGWSPPGEEDIFTLKELEQIFGFDHVQKAGAVFDPAKLLHLNGAHIRRLELSELSERLRGFIPEEWYQDPEKLQRALSTVRERLKLLSEAPDLLRFYFERPTPHPLSETEQRLVSELAKSLENTEFEQANLETLLQEFLATHSLSPRDLFPALRLVLTGEKASPGIAEMLAALGRDESLGRLRAS